VHAWELYAREFYMQGTPPLDTHRACHVARVLMGVTVLVLTGPRQGASRTQLAQIQFVGDT